MADSANLNIDEIEALLAEEGYDATLESENVLKVRDGDSGIAARVVLEHNVLYLAVPCTVVPESRITPELMRTMLDADNGITTSSFQLYRHGDGDVAITLNNFCKLQAMGEDDHDDILSCLEFLVVDTIAASKLLAGQLG